MATIDEKAMNGADLKRFAALIKKTASQSAHGFMSKEDKAKLDGIAAGAEVNVQADWNQTTTTADDYIKNKPTIDTTLSTTSTNAVQNKVVTTEVNKKVNTEDLASSASGKGAAMVGYGSNVSVKDALDEVYTLIENAKGTFEVTVTGAEGSYTANKTVDECIAAYNAGDLVVFKKALSSSSSEGWEKWIMCYTQTYSQQNLRRIQAYKFSFAQQGKSYSDGTQGSKLVASRLSYTAQVNTSLTFDLIQTEEDLYFGKLSNGKWYEFLNGSYSREVTRLSASNLYIDETTNKIYRWSSSGGFQELTVTVDNALSTTSENPVQNKVVKAALDDKQDKDFIVNLQFLVPEEGQQMGVTGDKTFSDITTAVNAGRNVYAVYSDSEAGTKFVFEFESMSSTTIVFTATFNDGVEALNVWSVIVHNNDTWNVSLKYPQEQLESGTTIKTVNNTSLLGSGNVDVTEFTELTAEEGLMLWTQMMGGTISDQTAFNAMCEKINAGLSAGKQIRGTITTNDNVTFAVISVNGVRYSATSFMLMIYSTLWEYTRYLAHFSIDNGNWDVTGTQYISLNNHNIGENIRYEYDATSEQHIFSAVDEKVAQTASSANADIPLLLASGATPETAGAKYDADFKFNPSTNTLKVGAGTLTATNYSGNAATATNATNDSAGNNIVNTYATKQEVMNPHPTIVQSYSALPTADGTHHGLYFVKDTSSTRDNVYTEYIEVQENSTWKWEPIGSTDVTLDVAYLTTSEVESIWNDTVWT